MSRKYYTKHRRSRVDVSSCRIFVTRLGRREAIWRCAFQGALHRQTRVKNSPLSGQQIPDKACISELHRARDRFSGWKIQTWPKKELEQADFFIRYAHRRCDGIKRDSQCNVLIYTLINSFVSLITDAIGWKREASRRRI